jgi:hypothetical protein
MDLESFCFGIQDGRVIYPHPPTGYYSWGHCNWRHCSWKPTGTEVVVQDVLSSADDWLSLLPS